MGSPVWKDSNQNMQVNGRKVCMVQPKAEIDLQLELTRLSTPWGYLSSLALCVTTFGTIALMRSFFLKPDATFNDYLANVVPLFSGFNTILGVSEMATRITAARYGVKLSPSFLVPSNWTGCLGVMNNYESLLPNQKALFDIPVARTASAYLTSLFLAVAAFVADGSFNGGDNALYIRHQFFFNNPLLSFIQFVIGPYTDNLGNVLPYTVEGVGVPVDPLAFAGLLGDIIQTLKANEYEYTWGNVTVKLAESYGFCWGVERAIEITYEAKKQFPEEKIWITNEIIHNPTVSKVYGFAIFFSFFGI
ncbi:putative zinc metallopeptidase EGY3, chloroplastic [Heracleum sosnowskyi]|uniref:4-hydroxy-3-methylbut-2-enyl diphosphate reductase n=1 Tax=Heracleum sosnowskyi TaxID=360622 RepID=A0AAD8IB44_9APIA|nr:putative zinc metallopeptidase EGY3, chloroplastic [Heracleum sosnowskyi]